jgi:Flp pilus assembly pilin Flp
MLIRNFSKSESGAAAIDVAVMSVAAIGIAVASTVTFSASVSSQTISLLESLQPKKEEEPFFMVAPFGKMDWQSFEYLVYDAEWAGRARSIMWGGLTDEMLVEFHRRNIDRARSGSDYRSRAIAVDQSVVTESLLADRGIVPPAGLLSAAEVHARLRREGR